MGKFNEKYCIFVTAAFLLTATLSKAEAHVEDRRKDFNPRRSEDLRKLAHLDLELIAKLKETWPADGQESSQSLLATLVEACVSSIDSTKFQ